MYCPLCRCEDATVRLDICDGDTFTCQDCDEEFTAADVRAMVEGAARWAKMLAWVEQCPCGEQEGATAAK